MENIGKKSEIRTLGFFGGEAFVFIMTYVMLLVKRGYYQHLSKNPPTCGLSYV